MPKTYVGHNVAKLAAGHFLAGSGDAASAVVAEAKAQALDDILQEFFQSRGEQYDGSDISLTDVKKAIIYARGKKHTKAIRKGVIAGSKMTAHVAATVAGATVGSVVPIAGTALGGLGGYVAGMGVSSGVTVVDRMKRSSKGIYKYLKHTRGEHRLQAAQALMYNAAAPFNRAGGGNPADQALLVLLQEEYDQIMALGVDGVQRVADRIKSN